MCGRYTQTHKLSELMEVFEVDESALDELIEPSFNIAPSQQGPVIYLREKRIVHALSWGLQPVWAKEGSKRLINARSESVRDKPSFRHLIKGGRCAVPANGFYEFDRARGAGKAPHYFFPASGEPIAFAGLWEEHDGVGRFTILTTAANKDVCFLHDRMPVILERDEVDDWIQPEMDKGRFLELVKPRRAGYLSEHGVSSRANSVANNDPDLITPQPSQGSFF